jgi:hypothetical protein
MLITVGRLSMVSLINNKGLEMVGKNFGQTVPVV